MALHSNTNPVYVALLFILYYVFITAGSGLSSESSSGLLAPYDEHYYRGVRAYFRDDWERAAEFLEKSISTRDKLLRTRRKCHDECLTAGDDKISKLGNYWIQVRAECVRFCMGQSFSPAALLPVSSDIEYEFGTRNPYNYLQVTYYKLEKMAKAASAAHTFFVANPSHLEMRNNLEKYRRILGVKEESFQDREREQEQHWVSSTEGNLQSAHKCLYLKKWKECVNETLKQTEECRAQCVMVSRVIPEEPDTVQGLYERAADLSLSLLSCKQMCVTLVSTRPGRVSAVEDFLPLQLEHLHIAQFKAGDLKGAVETLRSLLLFYPTDSDSLSNLELYTQTVEVNTEAQETGPMQEIAKYISRALQEKRLLYFGMANLDFKFSDPDLWTPEDIVAASMGDGYRGRRSPHTPHEKFEGLTVLRALQLAQDGLVNQSDARLLHEIGETVKVLMDSYFRSHSVLYFAYTHLVCRSAIPGHQEGRSDLSHPVHVDNCILEPETRQCWREAPAFTHRDLSAVLYLNDDFEGGDFFFADRDAKTVTAMVKPKCGRLVGFTSGPVNPHGVTAVTAGRRCALALWFTTEKQIMGCGWKKCSKRREGEEQRQRKSDRQAG
uniref:procollagen-proline 3-dioxygenase n=1 Tax=Cyprinus carpio TaxID=7962 RepID=A0A8C1LVE1_CYPCA